MANLSFLQPLRAGQASTNLPDPRFFGESAFWTGAIGVGVNVIASQTADIDALSLRITALAPQAALRRPVVGQYLDMMSVAV